MPLWNASALAPVLLSINRPLLTIKLGRKPASRCIRRCPAADRRIHLMQVDLMHVVAAILGNEYLIHPSPLWPLATAVGFHSVD